MRRSPQQTVRGFISGKLFENPIGKRDGLAVMLHFLRHFTGGQTVGKIHKAFGMGNFRLKVIGVKLDDSFTQPIRLLQIFVLFIDLADAVKVRLESMYASRKAASSFVSCELITPGSSKRMAFS